MNPAIFYTVSVQITGDCDRMCRWVDINITWKPERPPDNNVLSFVLIIFVFTAAASQWQIWVSLGHILVMFQYITRVFVWWLQCMVNASQHHSASWTMQRINPDYADMSDSASTSELSSTFSLNILKEDGSVQKRSSQNEIASYEQRSKGNRILSMSTQCSAEDTIEKYRNMAVKSFRVDPEDYSYHWYAL